MKRHAIGIIVAIAAIAVLAVGFMTYPPIKATMFFVAGLMYTSRAQYDEAITAYTKAIDIYPDYRLAYAKRAEVYALSGNSDAKLADLDKALALNPNDYKLYLDRGDTLMQDGKLQEAIDSYNKFIERQPNSVIGYQSRATAYYSLGEYDKCIVDCDKILALTNAPDTFLLRARAYSRNGKIQFAIANYDSYIAANSKSENIALATAYSERAQMYMQIKEFKKAVADCTIALTIARKTGGDQEQTADALAENSYYIKATAYDALHENDDALINYRRYLLTATEESEEPDNFYHACARLKIKMPAIAAEARQHFDDADRLSRAGKYDEAIAECGKAIAVNPIFPEAYALRATAYVQKKQLKEATDDYSKAIEQNPFHRDYYIDRGNTRPRKDLQDYDLAIDDFGKAIELDPESAEAYDIRGECYRSESKGAEALADFHKATELEPDNGEYIYHEALELEDLLRKKEALADYKRYVELSAAQGAVGEFPRLAFVKKRIAALQGATK